VEGAQLALTHRHLSILALSTTDWQPFASEDSAHFLVFNGENYNYLELRGDVEQDGLASRSHTDTGVLLAALIICGRQALPTLVGIFALAWPDTSRCRLLLVRDPFDIKPPLLHRPPGRLPCTGRMRLEPALPYARHDAQPPAELRQRPTAAHRNDYQQRAHRSAPASRLRAASKSPSLGSV
jgi:asparagine synthase (glutamine-hydrolysing)